VKLALEGRPGDGKVSLRMRRGRAAEIAVGAGGTPFRDLLAMAGGATVSDYGIFVSGIMMGTLTSTPMT